MDKQFEYKGYVCKIYHFTRKEKITGYGAGRTLILSLVITFKDK